MNVTRLLALLALSASALGQEEMFQKEGTFERIDVFDHGARGHGQFEGSDPIDTFGYAVSGGYDVDGDGTPDLVISVPQDAIVNEGSTGRASVFSGATGERLFTMNGMGASDKFGRSVAAIGDVDGDDVSDFVVGAVSADPGGVTAAGQARVFSGADGTLIHDLAGPAPGSFLGQSVAGVDDVDGDGTPDVLVGGDGFATLYSGATGVEIYTLTDRHGSFGWAVSAAGDVNGDSEPDLLVGAPGNGGRVFVYSGPTGGLLHTVSGGVTSFALQGWAVSDLGDIDGDGKDDFIVAAPEHIAAGGQQGLVRVISGASGLPVYEITGGEATGFGFGKFGDTVDVVGDLDGDGIADFIAGVPGASRAVLMSGVDGDVIEVLVGSLGDGFGETTAGIADVDGDTVPDVLVGLSGISGAGEATIFSGATRDTIRTVSGPNDFGVALDDLGDVDGDLVPDVLVGASQAGPLGPGKAGKVVVLSGVTGAPIHTFAGAGAGDRFGFAVASLGDVTGDGRGDVLVGAPQLDVAELSNAGEVYLFSGADGSLVRTFSGTQANERLGSALARLEDLDDDDVADIAIGAPGRNEVRIISGASGSPIDTLTSSGPSFGASVAQAGGDIVVGSPFASPGIQGIAGRVELFSGVHGGKLFTWNGASEERLGTAVAGGLDWDGDGTPDVFAGGPIADFGNARYAGRVKVFSGDDGSLLDILQGETERGMFGRSLAILEDADGDGGDDLLVGAPSTDVGGPANPGEVHVYSGDTNELLATFSGPAFFDRFGLAVASAGDRDGDGLTEWMVGMPGLRIGASEQAGAVRLFSLSDCNGNGIPDVNDIGVVSRDSNDNGIPDECELRGLVGNGMGMQPFSAGLSLKRAGRVVRLSGAPPRAPVTLVVDGLHVVQGLVTSEEGRLTVPADRLGGGLRVQAVIGLPSGLAFTNTLRVR